MATHETLYSLFTDIADAIREKTGESETIIADDFPTYIRENLKLAPREECLTFSSPNEFTICTKNETKFWDGKLMYSLDKTNWTEWDGSTVSSNLSNGEYVLYFSGIGNSYITGNNSYSSWRISGTDVSCSGNIETILDYKKVKAGIHPTMADWCFCGLFWQCSALITPPSLPSPNLSACCYTRMFSHCINLKKPPELPATKLVSYCYEFMFSSCTGLTNAPELPATYLENNCYQYMFEFCSGLTKPPSLSHVTNITENSLTGTFRNCTGLTSLPSLNCSAFHSSACKNTFSGCSKIKLSETQSEEYTQPYVLSTKEDVSLLGTDQFINMFTDTGGTFTGTPEINTTYYLHKDCTIV